MPRVLRCVFLASAIFATIIVARDNRQFFQSDVRKAVTLFPCLNFVAVRLFNDGNRIGVICYECGVFENEIIRMFMQNRMIVVSNQPLYIKNRRAVSYVVFSSKTFADTRRSLLKTGMYLHLIQYLFVSMASQETVVAFANDLWRASFRDIAFLTLDESGNGTVQMPKENGNITLESTGYCSSSGNNLDKIVPYADDFYRFCAEDPCTLLHGTVLDDTVQFWREEDKLRLTATDRFESMSSMLIGRFTSLFGIVPYFVYNNLTWPQAAEKLISGELDMVTALMPDDLEILDNLEIVCWYRDRNLKFTAHVRRHQRDYPVFQLLTPFHYTIWICIVVALLLYILLLYVLGRLAGMGLIKERLKLVQIYEVMLGQDTVSPMKTSLRAVLALWMIFSLNLSIIYSSVFTSTLTDTDTEVLLKNLKELRESGMPISGPPIVETFLNDTSDPEVIGLRERYKITKRAEETVDAIMSNNTMGVLQQSTVDRLNWAAKADRNLRVYALSKPTLAFPILFFTKTGHPYRIPFERIVTEYRESGLLDKWRKYYVIDEDKGIAASQDEDDNGGILTMDHLGPVFKLFFMCQAVCALIFLIELIRFRKNIKMTM